MLDKGQRICVPNRYMQRICNTQNKMKINSKFESAKKAKYNVVLM